jgi:hypothetical protein
MIIYSCPFKCVVTNRTIIIPIDPRWTTSEFLNNVYNNLGGEFDYQMPDIIHKNENGPALQPNEIPISEQFENDFRYTVFYIRPIENRQEQPDLPVNPPLIAGGGAPADDDNPTRRTSNLVDTILGRRRDRVVPIDTHDITQCVVCMEQTRSVLFLPCRHLSVCGGCSSHTSMQTCPVCRSGIHQRVEVIVS